MFVLRRSIAVGHFAPSVYRRLLRYTVPHPVPPALCFASLLHLLCILGWSDFLPRASVARLAGVLIFGLLDAVYDPGAEVGTRPFAPSPVACYHADGICLSH